MSGCDRELNVHFYSAASLKYHVPDTWHDTTPSHIILTLGQPVLALPRKSECQARSSYSSTIFYDFGMSGPGIETVTSWVPQRGHSTNWAIGAGELPLKGDSNGYPQEMFLLITVGNYPLFIIKLAIFKLCHVKPELLSPPQISNKSWRKIWKLSRTTINVIWSKAIIFRPDMQGITT